MTASPDAAGPSLNSPDWDYTRHAATYWLRPNYADAAIDELCRRVGAAPAPAGHVAADVGAGTGNLTVMLVARRLDCVAVEPNAAMRAIGVERTRDLPVRWVVGTGEETTLPDASADLFAMGSSFNCTEPAKTLHEARRVLRPGGFFACMWNNRDLENDPIQREMEDVIRSLVPAYEHGSRREDQTQVIEASGCFDAVSFFERSQLVERSVDQYVEAWRSVRNSHWDLNVPEGRELFGRIEARMRDRLARFERLQITYTTRVWVARRRD
jgi:ubiquinone/menaquinone biosynthesis C-methylase UbiE